MIDQIQQFANQNQLWFWIAFGIIIVICLTFTWIKFDP